MNLGIVGMLLPSDEVLKIIGGQSLTAMEQAFGSNMLQIMNKRLDRSRVEKNLLYITSGLTTVGLNNIMPEGSKVGTLTDTAARIIARMGAQDLFDTFNELWEKDPELRKMLKEGGELHGVTDRSIIINTTAAFYAAQMAKNSRFRDVYSYGQGWTSSCDDDDELYNAPGTTGGATIIDLTDILKGDAAQKAIKDQSLITVNKDFVADATRSYFQVNVSGDGCTIIMCANDPEAIQEAKYRHRGRDPWRKLPLDEVWPNTVCGKCNFPLASYDSRVTGVEPAPLRVDKVTPSLEEAMKKRGYDVKAKVVDRSHLNTYLTKLLDSAINPKLMDSSVYSIAEAILNPLDDRGVLPSVSTVYNMPVAGESVGGVSSPENTPTDVAQTSTPAPIGGLRFPLTKKDCYIADGNYKCHRCGKEGFRKSNVNAYRPDTLPEYVPANDPGLEDSQQWAESAVCGPCARALKEGREQIIAKYRPSKEAVAITAAEKEVEVMTKAAEDALAAAIIAEEGVKQRESDIKKMQAANIAVPEVVLKDLEDAKYNLVTAEGAVAQMDFKVKEATQKAGALKNGTVKLSTTEENKNRATPNKASIISKPDVQPTPEAITEAIAGISSTSKNTTKKQSKAERKKAAALARKSAVTAANKKASAAV